MYIQYFFISFLLISCNLIKLINDKAQIDDNFYEKFDEYNEIYHWCPENYIPVLGNLYFGVENFCVMKYEAKNINGIPTSSSDTTPWTSITIQDAKTACQSLGPEYDIISNPEWMTIAHDIESFDNNWSSGIVGNGCLSRGNNGLDSECSYDGLDPEFGEGRNIKARHLLTTGHEIWDFSGNVWEMVDWTLGGNLDFAPTTCGAAVWIQIPTLVCPDLNPWDYMPLNPANINYVDYNDTYGLGQFYTGTGGLAIRGNRFLGGLTAGIYSLYLNNPPASTGAGVGFRCVYRTQPVLNVAPNVGAPPPPNFP